MRFKHRTSYSGGANLPWILLPMLALMTGAGMMFLIFLARYA